MCGEGYEVTSRYNLNDKNIIVHLFIQVIYICYLINKENLIVDDSNIPNVTFFSSPSHNLSESDIEKLITTVKKWRKSCQSLK